MSKSWRDKPANERDIVIKKVKRGNHRHMDPYKRDKHRIDYGEDLV